MMRGLGNASRILDAALSSQPFPSLCAQARLSEKEAPCLRSLEDNGLLMACTNKSLADSVNQADKAKRQRFFCSQGPVEGGEFIPPHMRGFRTNAPRTDELRHTGYFATLLPQILSKPSIRACMSLSGRY
jgi:hypothetical protein